MRVLATGSSVAFVVRPTSTLSGERLLVAGVAPVAPVVPVVPVVPVAPVEGMPALPVAAESVALPVAAGVGVVESGVTGAGCGDATAPPLGDICTSPFAVAAAALSAARLSLASSIVHAATRRASAAAVIRAVFLSRSVISPSV
jgi:hypothetical protein